MIEHHAYETERNHLADTHGVIAQEQQTAESDLKAADIALSHARRFDPDMLPVREMLYARAVQNVKNLNAAQKKPYFTRIDFTEKGAQSETYYIGKYGVLKSDSLEPEVVDWRAPVANLYYSGQIGPLKYSAPDGDVEGELTLKRQFGIENGELVSIFDTDIVAQDQYLQDALSQTTGERLKEIITTIQAEQNYVIRYPLDRDLVVQGVAGSGKTTIALHRIAYLLYTYSKRLQPEAMLILAPNPLFLNFISQVLPDLGVENVKQTTFTRFVADYLDEHMPKMEADADIHAMLSLPREELDRQSRIMKLKGSLAFMDRLEKWLDEYEENFPLDEDLKFGPVTIYTADEMRRFLLVDEKPFPLRRRLEEMKKQIKVRTNAAVNRINEWYEQECDRRITALGKSGLSKEERTQRAQNLHESMIARKAEVKKQGREFPKQALKLFGETDPAKLYRQFMEDMRKEGGDIALAAEDVLSRKKFRREDAAAIALIAARTLEKKRPEIRHIVIDEAQDFNPFEAALLKKLCRSATFTIVGDLMQGIAGYRGLADWSELTDGVFGGDCQMHELVTSYRNTVEIMEFATRVLRAMPVKGLSEAKPVLRHGDAPIFEEGGTEKAAELAEKWHAEGMSTIAVIARSHKTLRKMSEKYGWPVLDPEGEEYPNGIMLAPADAVKGLEFDAVIIADADAETYPMQPLDARLLYVCLTRALHKMAVLYEGTPTGLV